MRVGIVGDLHLPFEHPHYLDFCRDTFRHWKLSASDEASEASVRLRSWQKAFPVAEVAIGNHDARCFRTAHKAGIPTRYLRDYAEVFQTPGWAWKFDFRHDGVLYEHGSSSGKYAAFNTAINKRTSLVMGHTHTHAGVLWHANQTNRIFAMQVGCGIDVDAYALGEVLQEKEMTSD